MQRYDVAIVGSGTEGLIAAIVLARAGLQVALVERSPEPGGRAATIEFRRGFLASPYTDELPAIEPRLAHMLDLAHHGAILVPAPASVCISDEGVTTLYSDEGLAARSLPAESRDGVLALRREVERLRHEIAARAMAPTPVIRRSWFGSRKRRQYPTPWPGEDLGRSSLDAVLRERVPDPALRLHLVAEATAGRAVSAFLAGTGFHVLAAGPARSGSVAGGLGSLGAALAKRARASGVTILCDCDVREIAMSRDRAIGVSCGPDGEMIQARAVLSTLDLKHTFLRLGAGKGFGEGETKSVRRFRIAGQTARVLFALDAPPDFAFPREMAAATHGPIHVARSFGALNRAYDSWCSGQLDDSPLVSLRVPSLSDPRLAPVGKAVMTATVSAVPTRLFDGEWTGEKRERLAAVALLAAERAAPGVSRRVIGIKTIVGPDIESDLGLTSGDLDGGEIAPDQAFGFRPFGEGGWSRPGAWNDGRTPIRGLYLGGPSAAPAPFFFGVSGERAARAILADLGVGGLK